MTLKAKVVLSFVALVLAFGAGRYTNQTSTTKTQDITQEKDKEQSHTKTTTTTVKTPDGGEKTVTTIDAVTTIDTNKKQNNTTQTVLQAVHKTVGVSLLAGYDVVHRDGSVQYGMAVTKEILSPLTAGVWALNNGTIGVSVGINF